MTIAEKYQAERDRLELNRTLDWSTFSREFIAVGESLVPMTVQTWFDLLAVKSPILSAEGLTTDAVVDYIWRNRKKTSNEKINDFIYLTWVFDSTKIFLKELRLFWIHLAVARAFKSYNIEEKKLKAESSRFLIIKKWRLFLLNRAKKKQVKANKEADALLTVIFDHIKEAFDELPSTSGATSRQVNSMSSASGEAAILDEIAHRYGISPEAVLKMPLRRAFALQRTIRVSTIPDYKLLEPDSLRAIKSEYLNSLNNGAV